MSALYPPYSHPVREDASSFLCHSSADSVQQSRQLTGWVSNVEMCVGFVVLCYYVYVCVCVCVDDA